MAQPTSSLICTETAAGTVTADTFCALLPNEGAASVGGHLLPNPGQPLSFERCNPSGEAAPPFLHQHIDPAPNDPVDLGYYVSDAGQQSAMMASGAWTLCLSDPIHAAKIADQALAVSANCVEAHLIKARCSDCLEDALRWYESAEAAAHECFGGTQQLKELISGVSQNGSLWSRPCLRGYLKALHGCANTLRKLSRPQESLQKYIQIMEWRCHVPEVFLQLGNLKGCQKYMFKDQEIKENGFRFFSTAISWNYSFALLRFLEAKALHRPPPTGPQLLLAQEKWEERDTITTEGETLAGCLAITRKIPFLLEGNHAPCMPLPMAIGSKLNSVSQAVVYVASARILWSSHPAALRWLQQVTHVCYLSRLLSCDLVRQIRASHLYPDEGLIYESICNAPAESFVQPVDISGNTLLHLMTRKLPGEWSALYTHRVRKALVEKTLEGLQSVRGAALDTLVNQAGETPLHIACFKGQDTSFLQMLLEAGASPHSSRYSKCWGVGRGESGWPRGSSPLKFSINQGRHHVVSTLLQSLVSNNKKVPPNELMSLCEGLFNTSVFFCLAKGLCIDALIEHGLPNSPNAIPKPWLSEYGDHPLLFDLQIRLTGMRGQSGTPKLHGAEDVSGYSYRSTFAIGSTVRLTGLKTTALNGTVGTVVQHENRDGRFGVEMAGEATIKMIKRANLAAVCAHDDDALPDPDAAARADEAMQKLLEEEATEAMDSTKTTQKGNDSTKKSKKSKKKSKKSKNKTLNAAASTQFAQPGKGGTQLDDPVEQPPNVPASKAAGEACNGSGHATRVDSAPEVIARERKAVVEQQNVEKRQNPEASKMQSNESTQQRAADLDAQIERLLQAKAAAVDQEDFRLAADLKDQIAELSALKGSQNGVKKEGKAESVNQQLEEQNSGSRNLCEEDDEDEYDPSHEMCKEMIRMMMPGSVPEPEEEAPLSAPERAVHKAANKGDAGQLELLFADTEGNHIEIDLNARKDTVAPIHNAAMKGFTAVVKLLLEHQADPNSKTTFSCETPLHLAATYARNGVTKLLLEAGANPLSKDFRGQTPMTALQNAIGRTNPFGHNLCAKDFDGVVALLNEAVAQNDPQLSKVSKKGAGCAYCGKLGLSLKSCGRCSLVAYCGKQCQSSAYPAHRNRCKEACEVKGALGLICDATANVTLRHGAVRCVEAYPQLAVDLHGIEQVLASVPSDSMELVQLQGEMLFSCRALGVMLSDQREDHLDTAGKATSTMAHGARFAKADGFRIILEKCLDCTSCSDDEALNNVRLIGCMLSAQVNMRAAVKRLVCSKAAEETILLMCKLLSVRKGGTLRAQVIGSLGAMLVEASSSLDLYDHHAQIVLQNIPLKLVLQLACGDAVQGAMNLTRASVYSITSCNYVIDLPHSAAKRLLESYLLHGIYYRAEDGWSCALDWLGHIFTHAKDRFQKPLADCMRRIPLRTGRGDDTSQCEVVECLFSTILTRPEKSLPSALVKPVENWVNAAVVLVAIGQLQIKGLMRTFASEIEEAADKLENHPELQQLLIQSTKIKRRGTKKSKEDKLPTLDLAVGKEALDDTPPLTIGSTVRLAGLKTTVLNGLVGTIVQGENQDGRFGVEMAGEAKIKMIKRANLTAVPKSPNVDASLASNATSTPGATPTVCGWAPTKFARHGAKPC